MTRNVRDEFPPPMDVASALALVFAQAGLGGEDGRAHDGAVTRVSQTLRAQELSTVADLRLAFHCERERRLAEVAEMLGSDIEDVVSDALHAFLDKLFKVEISEYALPPKRMKRVGEVKLLFGSVVPVGPASSTIISRSSSVTSRSTASISATPLWRLW